MQRNVILNDVMQRNGMQKNGMQKNGMEPKKAMQKNFFSKLSSLLWMASSPRKTSFHKICLHKQICHPKTIRDGWKVSFHTFPPLDRSSSLASTSNTLESSHLSSSNDHREVRSDDRRKRA